MTEHDAEFGQAAAGSLPGSHFHPAGCRSQKRRGSGSAAAADLWRTCMARSASTIRAS